MTKFFYKILDYANLDHHDCENVEKNLNTEYGEKGFELLTVIDMGENNSNKFGKSARYRYIFKKNEN